MGQTKIEWASKVWNPITGCSPISEGCQNCYAKRMAYRLKGRYGYPKDDPFKVTFHPDRLEEPLHWKKPSRIFISSMGDLFHPDVKIKWIDTVLEVIRFCKQHIFMTLTKRPENFSGSDISNLWLGVSVSTNKDLWMVKTLLQIPATKRFVSVEPILQSINLMPFLLPRLKYNPQKVESVKLDWVICGGETGPKARFCHPEWVKSLRDQCQVQRVPFFFKGWGDYTKPDKSLKRFIDGREYNEIP